MCFIRIQRKMVRKINIYQDSAKTTRKCDRIQQKMSQKIGIAERKETGKLTKIQKGAKKLPGFNKKWCKKLTRSNEKWRQRY